VQALSTTGVAALTTDQVSNISTVSLAALKSNQVQALSTDDVVALSTYQVQNLTTSTIYSLTTTQIRAIETRDIAALTTKQLNTLSSAHTGALTTTQVEAISSTNVAALTTAAYANLGTGTPIILDLNGDGVKTQSITAGVKFDLFATGQAVSTGWVSNGDGLLVLDRNHDGQINDGSELFGSATKLSNGQTAPDGYAALRELDTNHDGVISSQDAVYADLRVWVDSNSDGVTEAGELKTLASLGIAKIDLNASVGSSTDNGNILGLTSTYETTDGQSHAAADVWFIADKTGTTNSAVGASPASVDSAIAALNTTGTPSAVQTVAVNTVPTNPVPTLMPVPIDSATLPAMPISELRSKVSSLAQAMGTFSDTGVGSLEPATGALTAGTATATSNTAATLAVVSMVDAMKQFDVNGNLVGGAATAATAATKALTLPGLHDPASSGVLTAESK
jgi:trimeric autotransporter adhesin